MPYPVYEVSHCNERRVTLTLLPCRAPKHCGVWRKKYRGDEECSDEERGWKDFINFLAIRVNPYVRRTPPLYFAVQNTGEEA